MTSSERWATRPMAVVVLSLGKNKVEIRASDDSDMSASIVIRDSVSAREKNRKRPRMTLGFPCCYRRWKMQL